MLPRSKSKKTMPFFKRQKYYFTGCDGDGCAGWNLALETLFPEPAFHTVIEAHGMEGYLDSDWTIRFKVTDGIPVSNGPRYSRMCKALWDSFGPLFDECGIKLVDRHTRQAVPIKQGVKPLCP